MGMNQYKKYFLFITMVSGIFTACQSDGLDSLDDGEIQFKAQIEGSNKTYTRTNVTINDVTTDEFPIPFYIDMITGETSKFGIYQVTPGSKGSLSSKEGNSTLNWINATSEHTFYSWTLPWKEDNGQESATILSFNENDNIYQGIENNKNCAILEKFIGANKGPVNYMENGAYVDLRFQHLVSKIIIGQITLLTNDGGTIMTPNRAGRWNPDMNGTMTFIGMPESATFYRKPEETVKEAPVVIKNHEEGNNSEVTYVFDELNPTFYVCPDIDFSNIKFLINFSNSAYFKPGGYYGDFSNVKFERPEYEWWDDDKKSTTILYAGEYMIINLTLTMGDASGPEMSVTINDWVDYPALGKGYPKKGIFNQSQAQEFWNNSKGGSTANLDELFDKYGEEIDGEKVFPLYDDISFSQTYFPVPKGTIFDGMGHTITLNTSTANTNPNRIGNCRDVFIQDKNGHMIYIDEDQNVYIVDEYGHMEMTQKGPLDPLTGRNNYYIIDFETGKLTPGYNAN